MLSLRLPSKCQGFFLRGPVVMAAIALAMLLLACTRLRAQDPCWWTVKVKHLVMKSFLNPADQRLSYLLEENVPLRVCPDTSCAVLNRLPIGLGVYLLEESKDSLVRRGIESKWYRVEVDGRSGWIWGGSVAQYAFGSRKDTTVKFLAGIAYQNKATVGRCEPVMIVKALRNGIVLDTALVPCPQWSFEGVWNYGTRGVEHLSDLIAVGVACTGGCGCGSGELMYAWTGYRFVKMIDLMGIADGDFSVGKSLIYPSDIEGIPGKLILVTNTYNDTDTLREQGKLERIEIREYFHWDGTRMIPTSPHRQVRKCLIPQTF